MTCSPATPKLTEEEISERLSRLNGWSRDENCIEKRFVFKTFLRAMSFVNAVAYAAESANHHPDIMVHYNEVTLRNWTHAAGGVTEYDLVLAERIDALIESL
jgi:4a-hydroxytetrahydrobiopterin dehydratase